MMCLLWWIASILPLFFVCTPIRKSWDPLISGTCIDIGTYLLGEEIPNCILDFVIVFLPLRVIQKLKLALPHKIILSFIFAMGSLWVKTSSFFSKPNLSDNFSVGVISAIRMWLTYKPHRTQSRPPFFFISNILFTFPRRWKRCRHVAYDSTCICRHLQLPSNIPSPATKR